MRGDTFNDAEAGITAETTAGDFGHTRRRSVRLACCSCSCCCCFTLLGGGAGLLIGAVKGIIEGVSNSGTAAEHTWVTVLLTTIRFLACVVGYAVGGLLIGAAFGGVIDFVWFGLLQ